MFQRNFKLLYFWGLWTGIPLSLSLTLPLEGLLSQSILFEVLLYSQISFFGLFYPALAPEDQDFFSAFQEVLFLHLLSIPLMVATSAFSSVIIGRTEIAGSLLILLSLSLLNITAFQILPKNLRPLYLSASLALQGGMAYLFFLYWLFFDQKIPFLYTASPYGAAYSLLHKTVPLWLYFGIWGGGAVVLMGVGKGMKKRFPLSSDSPSAENQ